ncbi:hypothetical protein ACFZBU_45240 [Embleya sp. NPDC008237]|uniref:hypothetical protein n=1 Tax=Embleya sp. NPDC008237 TaxID=3363978 RepID=UPI0036E32185
MTAVTTPLLRGELDGAVHFGSGRGTVLVNGRPVPRDGVPAGGQVVLAEHGFELGRVSLGGQTRGEFGAVEGEFVGSGGGDRGGVAIVDGARVQDDQPADRHDVGVVVGQAP